MNLVSDHGQKDYGKIKLFLLIIIRDAMNATKVTDLPANYKVQSSKIKKLLEKSDIYVPQTFSKIKVVKNELLTPPNSDRSIHLITAKLNEKMSYNVGDRVLVQPKNNPKIVERAAKILNLVELDNEITITQTEKTNKSLPKKSTYREILTSYLDIYSIPSRTFLEELSLIAKDEVQSKKLDNLATNMLSNNEYSKRCLTESFSIVDILEEFDSIKLSFEQLMTLVPIMHPRYYSICTSPLVDKNVIQFEYSVEKRVDKKSKNIEKLTSNYLATLKENDSLSVKLEAGELKIKDWNKPFLFVGLGTGLGVIKGLLDHISQLKKSNLLKSNYKSVAFVGVRHEKEDYIFRKEFEQFQKEGIVDIIPAFSQDQTKFISVMDKMEEFSDKVYQVVKNNGYYVYSGLGGVIPSHVEQGVVNAVHISAGTSKVLANQLLR